LLVAFSAGELQGPEVESRVERLGPIEEVALTRDGAIIRHYYQRLAHNYRSVANERTNALK
jgi:hypothetical protein